MQNNHFTADEIIEDVQSLCKQMKRVPIRKEFVKLGKTGWAYTTPFNSYNKLLKAAGLPIVKEAGVRRYMPKDKEEALELIQEAVIKHPGQSLTRLMQDYTTLNYKKILRMFGSTKNLVKELEKNTKLGHKYISYRGGPKIPEKTLIEEIKKIAVEHPEYKTVNNIIYHASHHPSTYLTRLGDIEGIEKIITDARNAYAERWKKRYPVRFPGKPVILRWCHIKSA